VGSGRKGRKKKELVVIREGGWGRGTPPTYRLDFINDRRIGVKYSKGGMKGRLIKKGKTSVSKK